MTAAPPSRNSPSQHDQNQEYVIDPNLYGPFGHRYHPSSVDATLTSHHVDIDQFPADTSWHDVAITEEQDHKQFLAQHEGIIPLAPILSYSGSSRHGFVTHANEDTQDSRYTFQSHSEKLSQAHLRKRSQGANRAGVQHDHHRGASLFHIVHSKNSPDNDKPHIAIHGSDLPITLRHLVKRPVIRQWLHGHKLFREKDERKPSQFELVFDLIFVAVVNRLGHRTAESSSAINVLKFVLSFWPCFSIWTDVRLFLNTSGTDDMLERVLLLGWMILLGGYCANVSGVELIKATPELLAQLAREEMEGDAPQQLEAHGIVGELETFIDAGR